MIRLGSLAQASLGLALVTFGLVADRALVEQAEAARRAAMAAAEEAATLTASAVHAALTAIEQNVLADRPADGVQVETLAIPPDRVAAPPSAKPYARRPRAELSRLLASTAVTPNGLPEAAVARIALGPTGSLASGDEAGPDVGARLLEGGLPVRPEDLEYLARVLGVYDEARVRGLQERLRNAPDPARIPAAPAFGRALSTTAEEIDAWTRVLGVRRRYRVGASTLLRRAGVLGRARLVGPAGPSAGGLAAPIPGFENVRLAVTLDASRELRIRALRVLLWGAVVLSILAGWRVRRAVAREAQATAREKAFLAAVTHELRSPLASTRLLAETLASGRGDAREYGSLIARESERLAGLVERVLSLARTDAPPSFGPVEPASLVRRVLDLLAPRAERRKVLLEFETEALPEAFWDAEAVRGALQNLVENAVVHGREGGRVAVTARTDADTVRISVSDDGPGIRRQERRSVFERFRRGRTDAPGSGLGLYLVERVAHAHGGRVDLETEEGRGATFTLVLPVRPPASREEPA